MADTPAGAGPGRERGLDESEAMAVDTEDSGGGTAPDMSGAGRRLDVRVLPNIEMDTWWFCPQGDALHQALQDDAVIPAGGPRPILCDFGEGGVTRPLLAWPSLPDDDRGYDGAPAERVLLTVSRTTAVTFRPGRQLDIFPTSRQPLPPPVPGGTLESPAETPDWLVRALRQHRRSRADSPIHPARHRWQSTVRSCSVTADGHELSFTVSSYPDEVLAGFDVEETPERVAVRAWLAFGPNGPTTFGRGASRTLPDGRKVTRMARKGAERTWGTVVLLQRPLGTRPVVDVAAPDERGSLVARQAWHSERLG